MADLEARWHQKNAGDLRAGRLRAHGYSGHELWHVANRALIPEEIAGHLQLLEGGNRREPPYTIHEVQRMLKHANHRGAK